eukprot:898374-Prymnesium_polylepis.1
MAAWFHGTAPVDGSRLVDTTSTVGKRHRTGPEPCSRCIRRTASASEGSATPPSTVTCGKKLGHSPPEAAATCATRLASDSIAPSGGRSQML